MTFHSATLHRPQQHSLVWNRWQFISVASCRVVGEVFILIGGQLLSTSSGTTIDRCLRTKRGCVLNSCSSFSSSYMESIHQTLERCSSFIVMREEWCIMCCVPGKKKQKKEFTRKRSTIYIYSIIAPDWTPSLYAIFILKIIYVLHFFILN